MKRVPGAITVFLSFSTVLILALVGSCLEGARGVCLDALVRMAADSSVSSVFAAYQGEVKREYGLLLCRGRTAWSECWQEEARRYAEKYLAPGAGTALDEADRIRAVEITAQALENVYITEGEGRIFADAVTDYMTSAGLGILLQEVLGRLGLYSEEEGLGFIQSLKGMLSDQDSSPQGILENYENLKEEAAKLQTPPAEKQTPSTESQTPPAGGQVSPAAKEAIPAAGQVSPAEKETIAAPKEVKADLLEQIKAIKDNGLIAIITGTESLSSFSWVDATLPSALPRSEKSAHADYPSPSISLARHFLMGEFLLHRMGSYTAPRTGGSRYEIEYVLAGGSTDKASFETVVGEILLIRMGFNLAYLITDAAKLAQAEALAVSILTLLALPQLTLLLKWLLVAAWALAESIVDVKVLLKKKKVPLLKNEATWQLQALSLDLEAGNGAAAGLTYEDYLRILFYLGEPEALSYRMMDVIQKRISLKKPAFQLREYMVFAVLSVSVRTGPLYTPMSPFSFLPDGKGRTVKREARYAYERR